MLCFIVALEREASFVIDEIKEVKKNFICGKPVYEGKLFGKNVALVISGIGKVSAALSCQAAIDEYKPQAVINFGTAGGVDDTVTPREYYAVKNCCQFDFDLRDVDGVPLGYIQEYDRVFFDGNTYKTKVLFEERNLASADRFTEGEADNNTVLSLGCSLRDMEGGAIAQVCASCGVPLLIIKGVSDVTGSGSTAEQFRENLTAVSKGFPSVIKKMLKGE